MNLFPFFFWVVWFLLVGWILYVPVRGRGLVLRVATFFFCVLLATLAYGASLPALEQIFFPHHRYAEKHLMEGTCHISGAHSHARMNYIFLEASFHLSWNVSFQEATPRAEPLSFGEETFFLSFSNLANNETLKVRPRRGLAQPHLRDTWDRLLYHAKEWEEAKKKIHSRTEARTAVSGEEKPLEPSLEGSDVWKADQRLARLKALGKLVERKMLPRVQEGEPSSDFVCYTFAEGKQKGKIFVERPSTQGIFESVATGIAVMVVVIVILTLCGWSCRRAFVEKKKLSLFD